jgi:hypothetical protein
MMVVLGGGKKVFADGSAPHRMPNIEQKGIKRLPNAAAWSSKQPLIQVPGILPLWAG